MSRNSPIREGLVKNFSGGTSFIKNTEVEKEQCVLETEKYEAGKIGRAKM